MQKTMSFQEYVTESLFLQSFRFALRAVLLDNQVSLDSVELLSSRIKFPHDNESLLSLYLLRDELSNDIDAYTDCFGLELISTGIVLLGNLRLIHEKVNSRLRESYNEYVEKMYVETNYEKV